MADPQKKTEPVTVASAIGDSTRIADARPRSREPGEPDAFRAEIVDQLLAMSRFMLANDSRDPIGDATKAALGALDRGEKPPLEDLVAAHNELKVLIAPATPGALVVKFGRTQNRRLDRLLGPNSAVRNLALANMVFLIAFLGISLSPLINEDTIDKSIYDQSGYPLFLKLCFLISAAGLGASFGALFDLWDEIKTYRFDPSAESVHWMKISLGIVAGIALTEIVQASTTTPEGETASAALIALIGGFSAGLLHVVLSRMVNAIKSIFAPPEGK